MIKQEFQVGDTAYIVDEDYNFYEEIVYRIEVWDNIITYETSSVDFIKEDIDNWIFKSEIDRKRRINNGTMGNRI